MDCNVVQVTNIAPTASYEQITTLFGFLGSVDQLELFPTKQDPVVCTTKVAFVKFRDPSCVGVAQHLTSTVFIDRALMCVPYTEGNIPDETNAMQYVLPATSASLPGMAASSDPAKADEIRRTVYVGNLDSKTVNTEQLKTFFSSCGDVRFVRMAGDETQPTRFAFVEFASVESAQNAMQMNGAILGDRPVKINHSNNAIVKPPGGGTKVPVDATAREIDEAMRRVREAQNLISKALEGDSKSGRKRSRTRSRSRSRHRRRRSRSSDRRSSRRRRSRSKSHGRSRSSRRSRSGSRSRRRSRRSRSKSRDRKRKKTRSRSPRRRSGSGSPNKKSSKSHRKDRKRDRERDRDRDRKRNKHDDKQEKHASGGEEKEAAKPVETGQNGSAIAAET